MKGNRVPRTARVVVPGLAHHVIQRGNRRQRIFFTHGDCRRYVAMLAEACRAHSVSCLAWCLMPNHVHLVLKPAEANGLRAVMSSVNTRHAQRINRREQCSGHLFQDRFRSHPMDDAHLMIAVRYVENNPVKAGLVHSAEDWRWSSARAHLGIADDPLTEAGVVGRHIVNWSAYLSEGLEAADDAILEGGSWRGTVPDGPGGGQSPFGDSPRRA